MMIIDDTYTLYALLVSNAFLIGAAAIAVLRLQRMVRNSQSFWNSPTGATLQDTESPSAQLAGIVDQRIASMQRVVDGLTERHRTASSKKSGDLLFDNAVRMAKRGASIDDLTRNCGLRTGEAQLMMRVHAKAEPAREAAHSIARQNGQY